MMEGNQLYIFKVAKYFTELLSVWSYIDAEEEVVIRIQDFLITCNQVCDLNVSEPWHISENEIWGYYLNRFLVEE